MYQLDEDSERGVVMTAKQPSQTQMSPPVTSILAPLQETMLLSLIVVCPGICNHRRKVWLKHKLLPMPWRQLAWVIWICALEPELQPGYWLQDRHNHRDCSDSYCTSSPAVFWHWQNKLHKLAGTQNIDPFHFSVKQCCLILLEAFTQEYLIWIHWHPCLFSQESAVKGNLSPVHGLSRVQISHFPMEPPSVQLSYWESFLHSWV